MKAIISGPEIRKVSFLEALRSNNRMLNNKNADRLLDEGLMQSHESPFWTRTIVVHPAAKNEFSEWVVYEDKRDGKIYRIDTRDYAGAYGIALVFDHYNLRFEQRENCHIYEPVGKITIMENFPQVSGWYLSNGDGIPFGEEIKRSVSIIPGVKERERYLHRMEAERVGPIARGCGNEFGTRKCDVNINYAPSIKLVETPSSAKDRTNAA